MTSGGRQKKVGLRRIDAALDALCALGFSKGVVSKTVNKLLKAYGGDTGWVFIEEASYKLVIDTILDQQEEHDQNSTTPEEHDQNSTTLENGKDDVVAGAVHSDPTGEVNLLSEPSRECNFVDVGVQAEPEDTHAYDVPETLILKRRPPCYGWISEDEEEEEENFGNVTTVLQRDAFQKSSSSKRSVKRKSMWDIMHSTCWFTPIFSLLSTLLKK